MFEDSPLLVFTYGNKIVINLKFSDHWLKYCYLKDVLLYIFYQCIVVLKMRNL